MATDKGKHRQNIQFLRTLEAIVQTSHNQDMEFDLDFMEAFVCSDPECGGLMCHPKEVPQDLEEVTLTSFPILKLFLCPSTTLRPFYSLVAQ